MHFKVFVLAYLAFLQASILVARMIDADRDLQFVTVPMVVTFLGAMLWLAYLRRSRRVPATFLY